MTEPIILLTERGIETTQSVYFDAIASAYAVAEVDDRGWVITKNRLGACGQRFSTQAEVKLYLKGLKP